MDYFTKNTKRIKEGFIGQVMIVLPPDARKSIKENALISSIHLTAIGFYPNASYHNRIRKEGCEEYILLYCIKGEGELFIDDIKQNIIPNSYVIIPANKPHHYRSSLSNPWSIYWIHFTGNQADFLYSRYTKNTIPQVNTIPYLEKRLTLFNQIIKLFETDFSERNIEIANIYLLYYLSPFIYHSETNPLSLSKDVISKSIEYMKENLNAKLSLEELAGKQNLSISRYSELFKEKTGSSPIKYFVQLKIQQSCQYLYFTDMSIKEISFKFGFEDAFYFSRIFKKLMGVPPSKYKSVYKK